MSASCFGGAAAGRINAVLVAVREFLKYAVAAVRALPRVLSALYEIGDDRWMPDELRGERLRGRLPSRSARAAPSMSNERIYTPTIVRSRGTSRLPMIPA
jgi:hypothetical protein